MTNRFRRILEVNIAVFDLDRAADTYRSMGLTDVGIWEISKPPVETRTTSFPIANANLSLIEPLHDEDPIARFLARRGEGIFSFTFLVDGIREVMREWRSAGIQFVLDEPFEMRDVNIVGTHVPWLLENWTRPSSLHGTVIELQDHRNHDGSLLE